MINLQSPIKGLRLSRSPQGDISQFFGENLNPLYKQLGLLYHNGIDIAIPNRTPVLASHDGTITEVSNEVNSTFSRGYGVYLTHSEGWFTVYWHMLPPNLKVGDVIKAGEPLGYSDNSGQSTGPHLHFGLYAFPRDFNNGVGGAIDPLPYLQLNLLTMIRDLLLKIFALKGR